MGWPSLQWDHESAEAIFSPPEDKSGELIVEKKGKGEPQDGQAAELLGDWRAAERDADAAKSAAKVASLALQAAHAAEEAAAETEVAARVAAEAVERALAAARSARKAASAAAEPATLAMAVAEGDRARAKHEVDVAEKAEDKARDKFRDAEMRGFSKESDRSRLQAE